MAAEASAADSPRARLTKYSQMSFICDCVTVVSRVGVGGTPMGAFMVASTPRPFWRGGLVVHAAFFVSRTIRYLGMTEDAREEDAQ
jgi:hypothetical protein